MKNVIVIEKDGQVEAFGSLTKICEEYPSLPYHYLKKFKFPFEYAGVLFRKVPYNEAKGLVKAKKDDKLP